MRHSDIKPCVGIALGLLAGCNNVSTSVLFEEIAAPEDPLVCGFQEDGDIFRTETTLNTFPGGVQQLNLRLRARLFNGLNPENVEIARAPAPQTLNLPTRVTPVRFDFRWECESSGFTVDLGPFILPQFSVTQPFCLNERDEVGDFVGFDAVAASGAAIQPGEIGLATFQPVPPQLGLAFDEFFRMATLANACCQEVGGDCNDVTGANLTGTGACALLQDLFDAVSGGFLNANVPADVQRWQPYSIYDGTEAPFVPFASFGLRMRGRFELVTGSGSMLTSNELLHTVNICRGCGSPTSACTQ